MIGYLVGKISGMPFEQFLKERIFDPLGMTDTDFFVPADKAHRFAACYSADPQGGMTFHATERKGSLTLQDDPTTSSFLTPPSFISGGGGLCSTAADYLTFCRALLNGGELGGVRLLGPKTLALMTSNHLPGGRDLPEMSRSLFSEATYNGIGFGLGFSVTMDPGADADPRQRRRIRLGRCGDDVVLDRSGGRADRDLHDPGAAVERLSAAARAAHHGLLGDHRQQSLRASPGTRAPQAFAGTPAAENPWRISGASPMLWLIWRCRRRIHMRGPTCQNFPCQCVSPSWSREPRCR